MADKSSSVSVLQKVAEYEFDIKHLESNIQRLINKYLLYDKA